MMKIWYMVATTFSTFVLMEKELGVWGEKEQCVYLGRF